ncbi:hypothetical protein EJ03DRAFT_77363 [Teratosphaeria nubilosa]|uniref:Uncharacterized protein n=1 Tax=Teratosphaeria nubilosa TaxID=161662 RepID=A0A6G1LC87_9PEZI|nr:hypothetical protein EJ03DRAFT_77363 [Teratosphaeria nubilosa]
MSQDMTTDRLSAVCTGEKRTGTWITLDLICHEDRQVELFGHGSKAAEMHIELLLSFTELATSGVIDTEERHDGVDDEEAEVASGKLLSELGQELVLMLAVLGTCSTDVLVRSLRVQAKAFSDLDNALRTEGSLGVCRVSFEVSSKAKRAHPTDVSHLASSTALLLGHLSNHSEGVSELRLSTTELPIHLTDAPRLKAAIENGVPLLAAGRDAEAAFANDEQFSTCHEAIAVGLRWCQYACYGGRSGEDPLTVHFLAASLIFSTLPSDSPLILASVFEMAPCTDATV